MALFTDVHTIDGDVSATDVAKAHQADLETQSECGVSSVAYWVDETAGMIFCRVDAASAANAITAHYEAHGLMADEIHPVGEHV